MQTNPQHDLPAPPQTNVDISFSEIRLGNGEMCYSVRYRSGLMVYDEAFLMGKWIGRYWSSDGTVRPEHHLIEDLSERMLTTPIEAFHIELDGQSLKGGWQWHSASLVPEANPEHRHCVVTLLHSLRPVTIKIHTLLDGTPFIIRWLEITNTGAAPSTLSQLATWSGPLWTRKLTWYELPEKPDSFYQLGYFQSSMAHFEGDFRWRTFEHETFVLEGRRGHSGYGMPYFIARNEEDGTFFIGHLAWSGNWAMEFLSDTEPHGQDTHLCLKAGPKAPAPQYVLAPGETILAPRFHLGHMHGELDESIQSLHTHIRKTVIPAQPKGREMLVHYNALCEYGNYFLDKNGYYAELERQADIAKSLGAEIFVIDSGWYGRIATHGPQGIVGDWRPNDYLPHGLKPIRDYVRSKGLLFGLYCELEAIGFSSELFETHRDWPLYREGNLVFGVTRDTRGLLDLNKPEVAQWVENEMCRLIDEYDLDMFRLDQNVRYIYDGGDCVKFGFRQNAFFGYYSTLYAIVDRVRARYPNVVFHQGSSGGCRNDLGNVARFHEAFLTDGSHMPRHLHALTAVSMALPPEILCLATGLVWPPNSARGTLETQMRMSFCMSRPIINDVGVVPPGVYDPENPRIQLYREYIKFYKSTARRLLLNCKMFFHSPVKLVGSSSNWVVSEYAAPTRDESMSVLIRMESSENEEYQFRPRGIDRGRNYDVYFGNERDVIRMSGYQLVESGIRVRLNTTYASQLLHMKAVD